MFSVRAVVDSETILRSWRAARKAKLSKAGYEYVTKVRLNGTISSNRMTISSRSQQHRNTGSIPLLHTSGSVVSNFSGMTSESMDARLLSQATSTATMAARSVLEAGGSEATALKTARAAAKSILNLEDDTTTQSSGFHVFRRRRSRRQAEVVASMALVSATNAVRHHSEWDILSGSQTSKDLQARTLQTQHDMRKLGTPGTSVMGYTPTSSSQVSRVPPESPSLFSLGTSSLGRPPVVPGMQRSSIQTEPTIIGISAATSTKGSRSNGNGSVFTDDDSDKPSSIRVPANPSNTAESSTTPEETSCKDTPRRSYLSKIMAEQLSADDPIYYQDISNRDSSLTQDKQTSKSPEASRTPRTPLTPAGARGLASQISSESGSMHSVGDSMYTTDNENDKALNTPKNAEKKENYISKPFDMLSFGSFFACGGGGNEDEEIARQAESEDEKEQSVTDGDADEDEDDDDDDDDDSNDSMSSINSAAILRELNHSSDLEEAVGNRRADSSARKNAAIVSDRRAENEATNQNRDDSASRLTTIEARQGLEVPLSKTGEPSFQVPVPLAAQSPTGKRTPRKAWILPGRKNRQRSEV